MVIEREGEFILEVFNYKDFFYFCYVLEIFKKFYMKKELCDVVLIVDEWEIKVYCVVLVVNSVYFYVMFIIDLCESV